MFFCEFYKIFENTFLEHLTNSFWISSGCDDIVLTHFFRMFLFHPLKTSQNQTFSNVVSIQKGTFERNGLRRNFPGHFENTLHSLEKLPRLRVFEYFSSLLTFFDLYLAMEAQSPVLLLTISFSHLLVSSTVTLNSFLFPKMRYQFPGIFSYSFF